MAEMRIRTINIRDLKSEYPSSEAGRTGLRVYPTPPIDRNQAMRRKSKSPGSAGGLGGDRLVVNAILAPATRQCFRGCSHVTMCAPLLEFRILRNLGCIGYPTGLSGNC